MRFENSTYPTTKAHLREGLNMQGADVILRSSDLISFRVHKSTLAISSPFFNDMFSLPQPLDGEIVDVLPVVHVSEDSELLHSLLTVLYPIPSVIPKSYEKILALLCVAEKYDMSTALSTFRSEIGRHLPTTEASFHAYAVASSKQLPEMEAAARLTLDHPMSFEVLGDALPFFDGSALHDLVRFRKRCRDKLLSLLESFIDGSDILSAIWFDCISTPPAPESDEVVVAGWLRDLISQRIERLKETYTNPLPRHSSLHEEFVTALLIHISETRCPSCVAAHITNGEVFRDQLYVRVSMARDEVCILPLSWDCGFYIMCRNPFNLTQEHQPHLQIQEMPMPNSRRHAALIILTYDSDVKPESASR
jgi:hypothetical protein